MPQMKNALPIQPLPAVSACRGSRALPVRRADGSLHAEAHLRAKRENSFNNVVLEARTPTNRYLHFTRSAGPGLIMIVFLLILRPPGHRPETAEPSPAAIRQQNATRPVTAALPVAPATSKHIMPRDALFQNRAIPFVPLGTDRPKAFYLDKTSEGYARALDCLTSALLFEAGDSRTGQAAVAQVVLNRLRHPAFPHSVCGVVYQGSERASGCQFTFTCDGALTRRPTPAKWRRAQATAASFLAGEIDPTVGMATHYHTDWVLPYWSSELDKIAQVDTHLFFRWRGSWGRKPAFDAPYSGAEIYQHKLSSISEAHHEIEEASALLTGTTENSAETDLSNSAILTQQEGDHFILIDGGGDGTRLAIQGLKECRGQISCKVVGWDRHSTTYGSPTKPIIRTVAFLYVSDKRAGVEVVLWDCTRFNRPSDNQCLSKQNRRWITFKGDFSRAS